MGFMLQPPVATPHRLPRAAEPSSRRHLGLHAAGCRRASRHQAQFKELVIRRVYARQNASAWRCWLQTAGEWSSRAVTSRMPAALHTRTTPPFYRLETSSQALDKARSVCPPKETDRGGASSPTESVGQNWSHNEKKFAPRHPGTPRPATARYASKGLYAPLSTHPARAPRCCVQLGRGSKLSNARAGARAIFASRFPWGRAPTPGWALLSRRPTNHLIWTHAPPPG